MCIQNLRGMIANNSYNVNETDVKVQSLKELTDFNEPMVAVSSSLRQAKVCKFSSTSIANHPTFQMSGFSGTVVLLFQAERERFYSRISAGDQLYQDLMTSHVPETNNSLKELSIRVRNETCKSSYPFKGNTYKIIDRSVLSV